MPLRVLGALLLAIGVGAILLSGCDDNSEKPPTIVVSASSVHFTAVEGDADPVPQTVTISDTNTGANPIALSWTAAETPDVPWLALTNASGGGGDTVSLTVSVASLTAGTYGTTVEVSDANATNSPQTIGVTLTVQSRPVIALSAATVAFTAIEGDADPVPQTVTISDTNTGANPIALSWTAVETPDVPWLALTNASGGDGDAVSLTVSMASLTAGTYGTTVEVSDADATNSPQTLSVELVVQSRPVIGPECATVTFAALEGGVDPTPRDLTVSDANTEPNPIAISWSAVESPDVGWLSLANSAGGDGDVVVLSVSIGGLPAGSYSTTVDISDANASNTPQTVVVRLQVNSTPAGLVAYWKLDEGGGSTAYDSSGNNHDGALSGDPVWQSAGGRVGGALAFDGSDDYVATGQSLLNNMAAFTIAGWIRPAYVSGDRIGFWGQNDCMEFGFWGDVSVWTAGGGSAWARYPFPPDEWHHVALVGDGNNLRLHFDGQLAGTGGSVTTDYGASSFGFNIGGGGIWDSSGNSFQGSIDDVRVYDRALGSDEIRLLGTSVPSVDAGADLTITLPDLTVDLGGTVLDDGLPEPPGALTTTWEKVSGPGAVTFSDASAAGTTATFSSSGTYVLRLTADDGQNHASDETVVVIENPGLPTVSVAASAPEASEEGPVAGVLVVSRSGDPGNPLAVTYSVAGTASPVDYSEVLTGTALIEAGSASVDVRVTPVDDGVDEGCETVVVTVVSTTAYNTDGNAEEATVIIVDNDVLLAGGLIGNWRFDEAAGPVALDSTPYRNDGVVTGAEREPGITGGALALDGIGDYVECPDAAILNPVNAMSVAAWINADVWASQSWQGSIVSKDDWVSEARGFVLRCGAGGRLSFTLGTPGWSEAISEEEMSLGVWHHVAGTYDGAAMRIYIDGQVKGSHQVTGSIVPSPLDLRIGAGVYDTSRKFRGLIDDVRLYDRALSTAEVQLLATGKAAAEAGSDQLLVAPDYVATLDGRAVDDGSPSPLTTTWEQVSGPGTVSFADAGATATTVTFPCAGVYVLRLVADDGGQASSDKMTVTVIDTALPTVSVVAVDPDASEEGQDPGRFTFARTGDTSASLAVSYSVGGTAVDTDYVQALSGTVTIGIGASWVDLVITPVWDTEQEGDEELVLTVGTTPDYSIGPAMASAAVCIEDCALPEILLMAPNGGETWMGGFSEDVRWSTAGEVGQVEILLSINGGIDWTQLVPPTANDGEETVPVPDTPSGACRVRVAAVTWSTSDDSDRDFVIVSSGDPAVNVMSPIGGETWYYQGPEREIVWTSAGIAGNVDIHYTTDGTAVPIVWTPIATDVADTGSYTWTIPNVDSALCRVRVQEAGGGESDQSDGEFTITASSDAPVFADISAALQGARYSSLAWGDYDNDGDLDLALSGEGSSSGLTVIYRNDGGQFTEVNPGLIQVILSSLAWGDYDNDGDLDLVVAGGFDAYSGACKIYRNDGGDVFTDIGAGLVGAFKGALAWGDYDNDGDLDLVVSGTTSGSGMASTTRLYRNEGSDTFVEVSAGLQAVDRNSLAWADHDNDGDLDLSIVGRFFPDGLMSRMYRNNGDGTFTSQSLGVAAVRDCSQAWGDYDNDGDLDLALAGSDVSKVYSNDGGSFTDIGAGLTGVDRASVAWGDYDNDGDLDLVLSGDAGSPRSRLYRNDGGSVFTELDVGLAGAEWSSVAWGDYDNDGDLDLALSGASSTRIARIYRNEHGIPNARPMAPTGTSATASGAEVAFIWDAAADAETPAGGLSYNLRVGTSPGGCDVLPGTADRRSGERLVPALGNTQSRRAWTLKGLPSGTHYWSVQAIDSAFAGSHWTAPGSVTVSVAEPGVAIHDADGFEVTDLRFVCTETFVSPPAQSVWVKNAGDPGTTLVWFVADDGAAPDWLSCAPATGERPEGSSEEMTVTVDASGLATGSCTGRILILGSEKTTRVPASPVACVAIHLDVLPAAIPYVEAGPDQSVDLPSHTADLEGTTSDDGLPDPPGLVTTAWSMVSGPGTMVFGDAGALETTADFSAAGTYVLRLTADDGENSSSDDVVINIVDPANAQVCVLATDAAANEDGDTATFTVSRTSGDISSALVLAYSVSGSASPADYAPLSGTVMISANETSADVVLQPLDDSELEGTEHLVLTLASGAGYNIVPNRLSAAVTVSDNDRPDGLVALWRLDEQVGSVASDSSGNGYDGQLVGGPTWVPSGGEIGGALSLDGVDDYVTVGSVGIDGAAPRSVVGWVKAGPSTQPSWTGVFGFTPDSGIDRTYFDIEIDDNDCYVVHVHGRGWVLLPLDLEWHHLAATYDGSVVRGYLDGVEVSRESWELTTTDSVSFGKRGANRFNGLIDDVRIYDTALSGTDIRVLSSSAPFVDAGPSQTLRAPDFTSSLTGTVVDDGLPDPPGMFTTTWSKVSGPGTVTFAGASSTLSTATFSETGVYVIRLAADDGENVASDDVTINVWGDALPSVCIVASDADASEEGQDPAVFTVTRATGDTSSPLTISCTVAGSADAADYLETLGGTVTIQAGQLSASIGVTPVDDGEEEGTETIVLGIVTTSDYNVDPANCTAVTAVRDNDIGLSDGLVGYWRLDETEGTIAYDSSGSGSDGTLRGEPTWTAACQLSGGLSFDGFGDEVAVGKVASQLGIGGGKPRTVALWCYTRSFNDGGLFQVGSSNAAQMFCLRTNGVNGENEWRVQYWGEDLDFNTLSDFGIVSKDAWVHFAHVYDGTNTHIYVNGELKITWQKAIDTNDEQPFRLGCFYGHYYNGILDDVRLYNRAISSAEIAILADVPTIAVTSPSGGEAWYYRGPDQEITWASQHVLGNVDLHHTTDSFASPAVWTEIAANIPNTGSFTWTIPAENSDWCRVRVQEAGGGAADQSDADFALRMPGPLTLTSPDGGESWGVGSTQAIAWVGGDAADLGIELSRDGSWNTPEVIVASTDATVGSHPWTPTGPASDTCLIRIYDADDGDPADESDATFGIAAIDLVSPDGGEVFAAGGAQTITWTSAGVTYVTIGLSRDGNWVNGDGSDVEALARSVDAALGAFSWLVSHPCSQGCKVRISDAGLSGAQDTSSGTFEITGVTVVSPNGGAVAMGVQHEITWRSVGVAGTVALHYTIDSTGDPASWVWIEIASGAAGSGSYLWSVPATTSDHCRARVRESGGEGEDVSDTDFRITRVRYVDANAGTGGDGASWASAFQHPQLAVGAALAGDEIWVAEGSYGDHDSDNVVLTMKGGVGAFGGFAGDETGRHSRDWGNHPTVLDGTGATHVVVGASQAALDGFTVSSGNAGGVGDEGLGGGMYNYPVSGVTLENCIFSGNRASNMGGAIYNRESFGSITNCEFIGNSAGGNGGAITNSTSAVTITNCTFSGNDAHDGGTIFSQNCAPQIGSCEFEAGSAYRGGAIYGYGASHLISDCLFAGNSASKGGAVAHELCAPVMVNCVFTGNAASGNGGALAGYECSAEVVNCTFVGNSTDGQGGALYGEYGSNATVKNCILWGNTAGQGIDIFNDASTSTVTFSCVRQPGYAATAGNITLNPRFRDPDGLDGVAGTMDDDFRLEPNSPCIDSGTSDGAPDHDCDGNARPCRMGIDMGAYERE